MSKPEAFQFFKRLEAHLNSKIPPPGIVRVEIKAAVDRARAADRERHSSFPEGAFLNRYVIGHLHGFLVSECGLSLADARRAILSESYRSHPDAASGSPVRPGPHPFRKFIGASAREIMETWRGKTKTNPLARNSCPDLALRAPAPCRAVFEAKYVSNGGPIAAEAELVKNIYQAFFYLALPALPETRTHPAWDYEYACVLTYDATPDGAMVHAWKSLPEPVRFACWTGANVYVMILRGPGSIRERTSN